MKALLLLVSVVFISVAQQTYRPGDNGGFFFDTPETLPKGRIQFSNYELFIIGAQYGFTDHLQLSYTSLFPATTDFLEYHTFQLKYKLTNDSTHGFTTSAKAGYMNMFDYISYTGSIMLGKQLTDQFSMNGSYTYIKPKDDNETYQYVIAANYSINKNWSFLVEYSNFILDQKDNEDQFNGIFNFGFKYKGESAAFGMGWIRPASLDENDNLIGYPMLTVDYLFDK